MKIDNRVKRSLILETLNRLYPDPPIPLDHTNDYTLLVAVILSAQSTDKKVNELTVTYWMNKLQKLKTNTNIFVSLNPFKKPEKVITVIQ